MRPCVLSIRFRWVHQLVLHPLGQAANVRRFAARRMQGMAHVLEDSDQMGEGLVHVA